MSQRAKGFYWVRIEGGNPVIAEWRPEWSDGVPCGWLSVGYESTVYVADADVLAGPLQAPSHDDIVAPVSGAVKLSYESNPKIQAYLSGGERIAASEAIAWIADAVACMKAIRSRARALLEGTTPGPWEHSGHVCDTCPPVHTVVGVDRLQIASVNGEASDRDARFILGAHALLTELAKEGT